MKADEPSPVTVLLSGGMDSMACVHYLVEEGAPVSGLFIDYGQVSARREAEAAARVAAYFKVPLTTVGVTGLEALIAASGFVQGRNMTFVLLALMHLPVEEGAIAIAIHSGTRYADCTPDFVALGQRVLDFYTYGKVVMAAPFVDWNKVDIAIYCVTEGLPMDLTYSCELGLDQPCGRCKSCIDLMTLEGTAPGS